VRRVKDARYPIVSNRSGGRLGFVPAMLCRTNFRETALSVAASVKHRIAPAVKAVAPRWFWRRKFGALQRHAQYDPELWLVRSLCDPARVSLDIGACFGEYSVAMLESSLSVIAFEPQPSQARALAAMFDTVGAPVQVEAVALSDQSGVTAMRVLESDPGRSTIDSANPLIDEDGSRVGTIEVPVRRLDDLALGDVGFVKIDVEGHELAVLRGAAETLKRNRPPLLVEAEERHHRNAVAAITEFLSALGYSGYFDVDGTRRPIDEFHPDEHQNPSNIASWKDHWVKRGVYVNNFLFLPDQVRREADR
jgi:FkbM family methyltransferase